MRQATGHQAYKTAESVLSIQFCFKSTILNEFPALFAVSESRQAKQTLSREEMHALTARFFCMAWHAYFVTLKKDSARNICQLKFIGTFKSFFNILTNSITVCFEIFSSHSFQKMERLLKQNSAPANCSAAYSKLQESTLRLLVTS